MQAWLDWSVAVREHRPSTTAGHRGSFIAYQEYLRSGPRRRGRMGLELLDVETVEGFVVWLRTVRGNSPASTGARVRHISTLWKWAAGHVRYRDHVEPYSQPTAPRERCALRPYAPTWQECDAAIDGARGWLARLLTVCRYTGLRVSQAMALEWADLDLEGARLVVRPELGKTRQERNGRIVPVSPHLVEEVAGWGRREGHIICTRGAKRCVSYPAVRLAWERGLGRVPPQPTHAFRRAFVNELRRQGVQLDIIQFLIGHAGGLAADVYMGASSLEAEARAAVGMITRVGDGAVLDARRAN